MMEINKILEEYSKVNYCGFSGEYPLQKDRMKIAKEYLSKYWIDRKSYQNSVVPLLNRIFENIELGIETKRVLHSRFSIVPRSGDRLLDEEEFRIINKIQNKLQEKQLFIIQNEKRLLDNSMFIKLGFPSNLSWDEISNGAFIPNVIFNMPYNEYMMFGESAKWGCYSDLETDPQLNIWGVSEECFELIPDIMPVDIDEIEYVKNNLPSHYRNILQKNE